MASPRTHSADVLREPWSAPPGEATIVMYTDGRRHAWSVSLPDGIQPDSRLVRVSNRRYHPQGSSHVTSV